MSNTTKKKIISLEVRDEYILGSGVAIGAVGSHASILLHIKFNENWDALNIHATWTDALGNVGEDYNQLLLPSHEVEERTYEIGVPAFATRHSGTVRLSFSGFAIGEDGEEISQVINTASGLFKVLDSNAVRLDDEQIDKNLAEQVQSELVAFGERITEFEDEMDEWERDLEAGENGYLDEEGNPVPGRVQKELERQENEDARVEAEENRKVQFNLDMGEMQSAYEAAEAERDRLFNIGEGLRFEAEGERSRAEEDRVSAEKGRVAAEKLREEAAAAREESFSYLADPNKIPIRDDDGNIAVNVDEEVIANRERVAVDGYSVYMYVNNLLNLLVDGAPGTMDTFKEIADLLGSGDDAATILGKIAQHTNEISGINEALAKHEGEIADLEARIDEGITLTEADKAEIVQSVLNALPSAEGVAF